VLAVQSIEHAFVRRIDDCSVIEVDFDADGIYDLPIYRGVFTYQMSACVSKASYLDEPPTCPDSADQEG